MKNLLIYINPVDKKFSPEHEDLTRIQIDNSLDLGWNVEDILLVTNFDYSYKGVKSIIVDDYAVFDQNRSTKVPAIIQLFNDGVIKDNEVYWFHDHDAFELIPIKVELKTNAGFTNHGWSAKWNAGSFFFKKSAQDIFSLIYEYMNLRSTNEQDALTFLWQENINDINKKCEIMNITYNIGIYFIDKNLKKAELPMKVAHFHPHKKRHLDLFRSFLPERLMTIFNKYGIH